MHVNRSVNKKLSVALRTHKPCYHILQQPANKMDPLEANNNPLLELIPDEELSSRQKALRPTKFRGVLPMHRWLREPTHLDDIDWEACKDISIWCENETVIGLHKAGAFIADHTACFMISHTGNLKKYFLECVIYGESEARIVETVTFLWSLKHYPESKTSLSPSYTTVDTQDFVFDFATLQPEQLAHMLDANPTRKFAFGTGVWNAELSLVLATRKHTMHLTLAGACMNSYFAFDDEGKAFVDALETRKSSFGLLRIDCYGNKIPFSKTNFERLLGLDTFETLEVGVLEKELVLLPFAAKAKTLCYELKSEMFQLNDFDSLNVSTSDLHLRIYVRGAGRNWHELPIALLNRMAILGHFERFRFFVGRRRTYNVENVALIVEALIRAIKANKKLHYLNLVDYTGVEDPSATWALHLQKLFQAFEAHKGLRTVVVGDYSPKGPTYAWLSRLLSRNRKITVLDRSGNQISNGTSIDKIYALNRFYNGSDELVKESLTSLRLCLVTMALVESASQNYQRTAVVSACGFAV